MLKYYVRCEAESASDGSSNWYRINWDKNAFEMLAVNFRITQVLGSTKSIGSNVTERSSTAAPTSPTDLEPTSTLNSSNYVPHPYPEEASTGQKLPGLPTSESNSIPFTTAIAAAAGTAAFVVLLLILLAILLLKVKRQKKFIEITKDEIDEFMLGVAAEKAHAKGINGLFVLPYDKSLEIPKSALNFRKP